MLRSLRIIRIGDDSGFICNSYWRRHRFEEIEVLLMLRSLQIVRISDGLGFIGDGYRRRH